LVFASQPRDASLAPPAPFAASQAGPVRAQGAAIAFSIATDLDAIESEWRCFETLADATVFQSFDWLSLWHRHVGAPHGVRAAVVLGRDGTGKLLFLVPLAVVPGPVRRLTFLGDGLCDYNAPLLAPDFSARVTATEFRDLWRRMRERLQSMPALRHDVVALTKMPDEIGGQKNPFLRLPVGLNASGAHLTELFGKWEEFYVAKRSSATRRRDRSKLKRLAEHGEVRFADAVDAEDTRRTLAVLIEQKSKAFARMGVTDLFALPGHRDFFFDLATNPRTRQLVHVSRLEVGSTLVAANLGLTFRDTYYHVLASYDDGELSRFGPGAAHLRQLLQRAIEHGLKRFDFTIGDERYKLEWSDTLVTLHDHVAAASLRGWPVVFLSLGFRRLKRLVKQTPFLWQAFSRLRTLAGALRPRRSGEAREQED